MLGNQGSVNQHGFDSREALRDTNPEMGGAFEVARQRQAVIQRGVESIYRSIGVVPQSPEVQRHAHLQETGQYDPVAEAEAITRQAAEQERQAAMGVSAREQLQGLPYSSPQVPDATPHTPPAPVSEIQDHVSYISQIADQRYNGNLPGLN